MKKTTILFAFICLLSFTGFSQTVPNGGFENWTSMGSYSNPNGWDQLNAKTNAAGMYTCTQGTPGFSGSYYLKLMSKKIGSVVVPAIAVCGALDTVTMKPRYGFADTVRSKSLIGEWQYMNGSAGVVSVLLTKWNSGMMRRDTIAYAAQALTGMVMSWTSFTINLTYVSGNTPDSCIIYLDPSGASPVANDYIYLDNVMFSGTVAGIPTTTVSKDINVYPNPAAEKISIHFGSQTPGNVNMQLTNMLGQVVKESNFSNVPSNITLDIETKGLAKDTYLLKITTANGTEVKKVVIQ